MIERITSSGLTIASASLTLLILVLGQAQVKAQDAFQNNPLIVEAAADRVTKRFYETLDFATIWRELAVSDTALRRREVEMSLFGQLYDTKVRISDPDKERLYIAKGNFNLLFSAVRFTNSAALDSKELFERLKAPYESLTSEKTPVLSRGDWNGRISKLDQISKILREYILSGAYQTAAYKAAIGRIDENEPEDTKRVREAFAGVLKNARIYVASHYLYFIEEQGELKLLTMRSRRRF